MVEDGGSEQEAGSRSKPASAFESGGGRLRFRVELRPGETTIVSWKKLLKENSFSRPNGPGPSAVSPFSDATPAVPQPPISHPSMPTSSKQPDAKNDAKDSQAQAGSNRLNNVIERIERMYAGNGSSDEEDVVLDDVPDDDEYDTDDSFIDDAELDDYFQVDNSAIKHDGFFVNRGKLERIEPTIPASQQPKKRRRKDLAKGTSGSDDGHVPNKHIKVGDKGVKPLSSSERKSTSQTNRLAAPSIHGSKSAVNSSGLLKDDAIAPGSSFDRQKTGVLLSDNHNTKQKEDSELQDNAIKRSSSKSLNEHKSQSGNGEDVLNQYIRQNEKSGLDLNVPASRGSLQTHKVPLIQRKEGSTCRPKSSMLEKAIRELEKIVSESRPPSTEVQDPDNSSQAVKRRLPPEIKQKLAKVARLTQVSYGKIPKDVIDRLMSILGHMMLLRTLTRNLKVMANMGLSVKQEKDNQVQRIKQEVADMVKLRIQHMKTKVDQQSENLDDFQRAGPGGKELSKQKYRIDEVLENKICDLYDLYVERLEEDSGPPVKRLYEELAALWPSGVMDAGVIKRAICRAKHRSTRLNQPKDQEKIKKSLTTKAGDTLRGEATGVSQASHHYEKSPLALRDHSSTSINRPNIDDAVSVPATARVSVALESNPRTDKPKVKGNSSRNQTDARPTDGKPKKKVKRKLDTEVVEARIHLEKVAPQAEERHKNHKPTVAALTKSNHQPSTASNSE